MFDKKILFSVLGGFILGRSGEQILESETVRTALTNVVTGAIIIKDSVMECVEKAQAGGSVILADAKVKVEEYYAERDEAYKMAQAAEEDAENEAGEDSSDEDEKVSGGENSGAEDNK